jgi:hypothetical protein
LVLRQMTQIFNNVFRMPHSRAAISRAAKRHGGAPAGRYASRLAASRAKRLSQSRIRSEATTIDTIEMTKAGPPQPELNKTGSNKAAAREARAERLAAALKANLRRRKTQARERREGGDVEPDGIQELPATTALPDQGS